VLVVVVGRVVRVMAREDVVLLFQPSGNDSRTGKEGWGFLYIALISLSLSTRICLAKTNGRDERSDTGVGVSGYIAQSSNQDTTY
jgi:hypothetical protein